MASNMVPTRDEPWQLLWSLTGGREVGAGAARLSSPFLFGTFFSCGKYNTKLPHYPKCESCPTSLNACRSTQLITLS